jgi:hypothetical protein
MNRRLHTTVNVIALLFVAAIAFSVSFVAIRGYAIREGWSPPLANAAPLLVDSLTMLGASLVLARAHEGERAIYGWSLIVGASAVSLTVNVAHAHPTLAAQLLAALPPVSLLASVEAVMSEARRSQHVERKTVSEQAVGKRERAQRIFNGLLPTEQAGISTRAFAARSGVSPAYGARVLRELRAPSVSNVLPESKHDESREGVASTEGRAGQEAEETTRETEDAVQLSRAIGNSSKPGG